jgi:hypothetical protein
MDTIELFARNGGLASVATATVGEPDEADICLGF